MGFQNCVMYLDLRWVDYIDVVWRMLVSTSRRALCGRALNLRCAPRRPTGADSRTTVVQVESYDTVSGTQRLDGERNLTR